MKLISIIYLAIGLHGNSGSDSPICLVIGKEVTLIWQEGQNVLEEALIVYHNKGWSHTKHRTAFHANLKWSRPTDHIFTFSAFIATFHTTMSCRSSERY